MKGIIKCGIHTTNHIIKGRCMCYRLYRFYFVVLLFLCLHTSIQAQISVEVTSGLALPGGDLESTYSSSLGYNVNLCNKVTGSSSEYLASYAFQTFSSTNSSENYKPIMLGSRYYLSEEAFSPFVTAQVGIVFWETEYLNLKEEGKSFCYSVGVGTTYLIEKNIRALASVNYNDFNSEAKINYINIHAGIRYSF